MSNRTVIREPRQARAVERRKHLLDAAARVFAQRGFAAAQMDEIAREASTSKGGLYFHFPTKEALMAAVAGRAAAALRRRVTRAMNAVGNDPVARAEAALAALFETLSGHRTLARMLATEALSGGPSVREQAAEVEDEFVGLIAAELRQAQAEGRLSQLSEPLDPELTARAWVGMARALVDAWAAGRTSTPLKRIYPELRGLLLRSAGVEQGHRPIIPPKE